MSRVGSFGQVSSYDAIRGGANGCSPTAGMQVVVDGKTYVGSQVILTAQKEKPVALSVRTAPETKLVCIKTKGKSDDGGAVDSSSKCLVPKEREVNSERTFKTSAHLVIEAYSDPKGTADSYQGRIDVDIKVE